MQRPEDRQTQFNRPQTPQREAGPQLQRRGTAGRPTGPVRPPMQRRRPRPPQKPFPFRTVIFRLFAIGLFLLALAILPSVLIRHRHRPDIVTRDIASGKKADAVLVFGAGVYKDGSPTPMLADRVEEGISLYFKGAAPKLLLSGDHGQKNYDEVSAMKQLALDAGVPEEDIFLDHAGFSTWDSLKRAKEVYGAESLCLVTQRYHLYRALYFAERVGLECWGVAADARTYSDQWRNEAREILAVDKAVFTALFNPPAEISGGRYDLSGDGRTTWD